MTKAEIRLSYGRVGELYDGSIQVQPFPTRGLMLWLEFEGYSYPRMMSKLAECIREHGEVTVLLSRTEVTGSLYKLDVETTNLLRTDPAAAISQMMPESRLVVIRSELKTNSSAPPSGLLRAGHDTIADAFGDSVYCEVSQDGKGECPGCGRWGMLNTKRFACTNPSCGLRIGGTLTGKTWFVMSTSTLLLLGLSRYYIPRGWNPRKGWISRDELQTMFDTFKKERDQCFQQNGRTE